jgi:hypothetical protein
LYLSTIENLMHYLIMLVCLLTKIVIIL